MVQRWFATPALGDVSKALDAMRAARKDAGEDLVIIEVVSAGISLPDPAATREARTLIPALRHLRSAHFVVIEGDGLRRKLLLGVFNVVAFVIGEAPVPCGSVSEAVDRACRITGQKYEDVVAEISSQGLLDHPYEFWA